MFRLVLGLFAACNRLLVLSYASLVSSFAQCVCRSFQSSRFNRTWTKDDECEFYAKPMPSLSSAAAAAASQTVSLFSFLCSKQLNQNGWDIISFIWLASTWKPVRSRMYDCLSCHIRPTEIETDKIKLRHPSDSLKLKFLFLPSQEHKRTEKRAEIENSNLFVRLFFLFWNEIETIFLWLQNNTFHFSPRVYSLPRPLNLTVFFFFLLLNGVAISNNQSNGRTHLSWSTHFGNQRYQ